MGIVGYAWVNKGILGYTRVCNGFTRVYNGYAGGIQGFIGYSQDIISVLLEVHTTAYVSACANTVSIF